MSDKTSDVDINASIVTGTAIGVAFDGVNVTNVTFAGTAVIDVGIETGPNHGQ